VLRSVIVAVIVPIMVAAALDALGSRIGVWEYAALQVYLFFVSANFVVPSGTQKSPEAIEAVGKVLKAIGHEVTAAPKTGDSGIDPLLAGLDLFAYNASRALAIGVRDSSSGATTGVAALRVACLAITEISQQLELTPHRAQPVIVVIDEKAGDLPASSHTSFSESEGLIQTVAISEKQFVRRALRTDNVEELKKLGVHFLGLEDTGQAAQKPVGLADSVRMTE
jgi:hypothetical protein